jgi:hypothetical protein
MVGLDFEHAIAAAVPTAAVLGMWLDSRRRSAEQHQKLSERLTRLETKLEPLWKWYTNGEK